LVRDVTPSSDREIPWQGRKSKVVSAEEGEGEKKEEWEKELEKKAQEAYRKFKF
jgi:hypothetical protein